MRMNFINSTNHNQFFLSFFVLLFFSFLPLSLILGNLAININIVLIDLSLILYSVLLNDWKWTKTKLFKSLILIQIYLIFSSVYSIIFKIDHQYVYEGLYRSVGFIKYVILVFSFSILDKLKIPLDFIIKIWSIIVVITIFDVFFEKIFGHNIFGFVSPDGSRIISFFKDEMVVGAFLLFFGITATTYFIDQKNPKKIYKIFFNILIVLLPAAILISGERSNFIKAFIIFSILLTFIPEEKFFINKKKSLLGIFFGLILLFSFNESIRFKQTEFFSRIITSKNENSKNLLENIRYFAHYDVAWSIFKDNPLIGIGSKNFRWECHNEKYFKVDLKFTKMRCSTHPHQIHFDLLSEQGIIGYILILGILLNYTFRKLFYAYKNIEIFKFSISLYIVTYLMPLLPSGSMFSTFSGSSLWIMLSLLYYLHEVKKDGNLSKNI